ncbi:4Fe-4S binding protein [[Clostridium] hylemonae]|uniref:pyridoxamine 5'-phosphate oxidase family protein n=1 Tax=[Clostridium] hylemonae TaxID=89153 RepID=UPI0011075656|nr:4Fe-4S binding protein [[Clostridium] hylemonae]
MKAQDCLNILREIRDVAFATVDEKGKPQVRIIDIMLVEEGKLFFCTARGKNFYRELTESGETAVTGMNKSYQMVRLSGKVSRVKEQREKIDRIFEENPAMKDVYPGDSRYILEAFCIEDGELEFFDLGRSPIFRESFVLGNKERITKGYRITDQCTGCGVCQNICPQQCIRGGTPCEIAQEHCLHCGLCYENCPVRAVERREL